MYNMILNASKLSCRIFVERVKCFSTSNVKLQPRGQKSVPGIHGQNPGIQRHLNILDHEDDFIQEVDDTEELDSDFMHLDKIHQLHVKEEDKHKRVVQLKMVGHKYFRPAKSPNLLTWAEKEQIRYLHNSDTEKWTIDKLAQSFPASKEIVKKVLKASWQPRESARIVKHDQMVQKNWELLRSGKLDIDPELKEHVMQFTDRTVPAHQHDLDPSVEEKWRPKPAKTEFGNIIESYKHMKGEDSGKSTKVIHRPQKDLVEPKDESYVVSNEGVSYMKYGRSTLDRYKERIVSAIKKGHNPGPDARLMLMHTDDTPASNQVQSSESLSVAVSDTAPTKQNVEIELGKDDTAPERIKIPYNKWKRGATFKMGDCYYDDDGSFLYRVPGMK